MSSMASEYNAINLGQGFPNYDCDEKLKSLIKKYLDAGKNQYCLMAGSYELRTAISNKVMNTFQKKINADTEVTITAGATQAIFTAITAFVRKDNEVIIIEPAFDSYRPSIEINGGIVVSYELKYPDYNIDWSEFSKLVSSNTRMIIVNTPHNPTGKALDKDDLFALQSLVSGKDIIVLSDEVYEHLVYDSRRHESVCLYPELFNQSIAVYSFGKTFHSTGWKIGYCLAPEHLTNEIRNIHQWNVFSVSSFVQFALAEYLGNEESYNGLSAFYQKKRDLLQTEMKDSRLKPLQCEGTYFQLYDYSGISKLNDIDFAEHVTKEYGVATIPMSAFFGSNTDSKVIRLCFAKTEEVLIKAAQRLSKV